MYSALQLFQCLWWVWWGGMNFLVSRQYSAVFWVCEKNTVDNKLKFCLLASSPCTVSRLSLFPTLSNPAVSRLRSGKKLERDTARTADPNWPEMYSVPCNITLGKKNGGSKSKGCLGFLCFPRWLLFRDWLSISLLVGGGDLRHFFIFPSFINLSLNP